jgi:hypothetical protein
MVLLLHILIALSSVGFTTHLWWRPSKAKLFVSYGLVGGTLVSGTYLVISTNAHMLQACVSGLVYVGVVAVGIAGAQRKLALENVHAKRQE